MYARGAGRVDADAEASARRLRRRALKGDRAASFKTRPRSGRAGRSSPGGAGYPPRTAATITAARIPPTTVRSGASNITRAGVSLTGPRQAQDGTRGVDIVEET